MQRFHHEPTDVPPLFKTRIENDGVVIVEFLDRDATSVVVPAQIDGRPVVKIDESAFIGCDSLTEFSVSSANKYFRVVDGVLFTADGKTLIAYPAGNKRAEYVVPNEVENVGESAFAYCRLLTSVALPDRLNIIGDKAFAYCRLLTSVALPDGLNIIGDKAFEGCSSLTSVALPNGLNIIGDKAFEGCSS
ncbi:MAG: leucine-rich repeat domain-containing protein, partial [Thermoguttaceae bacterium]|nr:leucine-rich repeat domain-containing protein [Thermoguttaceae bacterium]